MVGISLLFILFLIIFYPRISQWLHKQQDVQLFKPTWAKNYGSSQSIKPKFFGFGKYEGECRRILESIFQKPFQKIRPNWLKNPKTKKNLELDGYNEDEKLAFEYNGIQHAKFHPMHNGDVNEFYAQQERDRLKIDLCKKHGVKLLIIPHTIRFDKLESYIRKQLRELGYF